MMAVMHEAEPYGHLLLNGHPMGFPQLAKLVGSNPKTVSAALSELVLNGVCSRSDSGVIYSRRMVRDFEKAQSDQVNGRAGGNPLLKPPDNRGVNPPDKAHIPDTRNQKEVSSFKEVGKKKVNGWSPPRHGATGRGRVYVVKGSAEWAQYAEDYRGVHGVEPEPNAHGGKWFKTLGEAT